MYLNLHHDFVIVKSQNHFGKIFCRPSADRRMAKLFQIINRISYFGKS